MKKVLEISCSGLENGGVQHVIMDIISNLKNDFQFDIIVFSNGPDFFDEQFLNSGGTIFRIPNKKKIWGLDIDAYFRGPRIFFKTYKILKKYFISLDEYKKPCYYIADAAQRGLRA